MEREYYKNTQVIQQSQHNRPKHIHQCLITYGDFKLNNQGEQIAAETYLTDKIE